MKKGVLRNFEKFTGKHLCQRLFCNKVAAAVTLFKKRLAQVFSSEYCEISKNAFFTEHLWTTASAPISSNWNTLRHLGLKMDDGFPHVINTLITFIIKHLQIPIE